MEPFDSLIVKYLSKNISGEEQEILLQWLEENEENKIYFRSLKDAYDLGRIEDDMKRSRTEEQWAEFLKVIVKTPSVARWKLFSLSALRYAAVLMLGILCSYFIFNLSDRFPEKQIADTRIETGIGDKSKITLPDGSVIWLNSCGSVVYDDSFDKDERSVFLQGEAYFDVKTDQRKPFLVRTDELTYRVTGTSFNVYSFQNENETSIALLEGGVTIEMGNDHKSHVLYPGEIFTYDKTTNGFTVKKADVNLLSSWRQGEFVFDNMTFGELVHRLERLYNVRFVFENQNLKNETFGGTLRDYDSIEMIMKVIRTSIPIKYRIEENKVYIR